MSLVLSMQSFCSFFPSLLLILLTVILLLTSALGDDLKYTACSSSSFKCGDIQSIRYPFWGNTVPEYCGHPGFELDCEENITTIQIMSVKYRIMDINQDMRMLKISRWDFWGSFCPDRYLNTTLANTLFNYSSADEITTLFYNCSRSYSSELREFTCSNKNTPRRAYLNTSIEWAEKLATTCGVGVIVPILKMALQGLSNHTLDVKGVLNEGFEVIYRIESETECLHCVGTGGRCGYNSSTSNFTCFCPTGFQSESCLAENPPGRRLNLTLKLIIGFGAAGGSSIIMLILFFVYQRCTRNNYAASDPYLSRAISSDISSVTDIEKSGSYYGLHIFTYAELEEATDNFDSSKEVGDGAFGTVYSGKLKDGRVVAVKRLYENNYKRVQQFMNEVEILTRLRHKNLVSLYGCTSRHSQELLLVYEYIPNGTIADHLHGERSANPSLLSWPIRLKIAIETADALAYLHASEIIHRDVKTNNILLDDNFCVKVADFGLSRLFPTSVTHVSTAPQGTPGYLDPDYHHCYQLSDKSDVYSFGVVLIELISSKPAVDITRHRHEINLSSMAVNKIQSGALHELIDPSFGFESDSKVRKMMTQVAELAFACLDNEKDTRPCMKDVLNSLKKIESQADDVVKLDDGQNIADEAALLKNGPVTPSPNSVTVKWDSGSSITPNVSG